MSEYKNEDNCRELIRKIRWSDGCPKCKNKRGFWYIPSQQLYKCKKCNCRLSPTAGTIFQDKKLPFSIWFDLIYSMAVSDTWISTLSLKKKLDIKDYKIALGMVKKVRKAMSSQYAPQCELTGLLEFDIGEFKASLSNAQKGETNCCKKIVIVFSEGNIAHKIRSPFYLHALIGSIQDRDVISKKLLSIGFLQKSIENIHGFKKRILKKYEVICSVSDTNFPRDVWDVFRATGNSARIISSKYIEGYLAEVCFRFNNKRLCEKEKFMGLLEACIKTTPHKITALKLNAFISN